MNLISAFTSINTSFIDSNSFYISNFYNTFFVVLLFIIYNNGYEYKNKKSIYVYFVGDNDDFIGNNDNKNERNGSDDVVSVIVVNVSDEHSEFFGFNIYSKS